LLTGIGVGSCLIFIPFLPSGKAECRTWKKMGEEMGSSKRRGNIALLICVVTFVYGLIVAILLLGTLGLL
jgi:hypothetical protein